MLAATRLFTGILLFASGVCLHAADRIETPLELVPLWSQEMLDHLTGTTEPACSGTNAGRCERLNTGVCDGTAYFRFLLQAPDLDPRAWYVPPAKQTNSAHPQFFLLRIANAGYGGVHDIRKKTMDLLFDCQYSGNDACSTSRFHVGVVHAVEIGLASGEKTVDLTQSAKVLLDGKVAVPVDRALRQSLVDTRAMYKVRAVVECFTVRAPPVEWTFPVHEAPSPDARSLGAVIARVVSGRLDLVYRPVAGQDVPFETDWVAEDWRYRYGRGYRYLRDQTILDRKGDWFLLPRRPFPNAVWIHLPGRAGSSHVFTGKVYSLSRQIEARLTGTSRSVTLDAGNFIVVAVHGRTLEIKEEDFDNPCTAAGSDEPGAAAGSDEPGRAQRLQTYSVEAEALYDSDLHLQLTPAYKTGC